MEEGERRKNLNLLYDRLQRDPRYRTSAMGARFVPGVGSLKGDVIVFVGEAPGREEEEARMPFVGAAGKNLDALLRDIGLSREDIFITNLVKFRPMDGKGGNRSPSSAESRYAFPYLLEELKILKPRAVVCLGLSSAKALLNDPGLRMGNVNGASFERYGLKIFVTYHPSPFNYRTPVKREALRDAFRRMCALWIRDDRA